MHHINTQQKKNMIISVDTGDIITFVENPMKALKTTKTNK